MAQVTAPVILDSTGQQIVTALQNLNNNVKPTADEIKRTSSNNQTVEAALVSINNLTGAYYAPSGSSLKQLAFNNDVCPVGRVRWIIPRDCVTTDLPNGNAVYSMARVDRRLANVARIDIYYDNGETYFASSTNTGSTWTVWDKFALNTKYPNTNKILSIATDGSSVGFWIQYPSSGAFSILYTDIYGRIAHIYRSSGNASLHMVNGTFNGSSLDASETYLNVGNWVRAQMIITASDGTLDNIQFSTYTT